MQPFKFLGSLARCGVEPWLNMVSLFAISWAVVCLDLSCMFTLVPITQYQDGNVIRGEKKSHQKFAVNEE